MKRQLLTAFLFLFIWQLSTALSLEKLSLPAGFSITVYAKVPNARSLTLGDDDIVFVGTLSNDKVFAVVPNADRTKATSVFTIAENLTMPNGVAYHNGALYVAERTRILRFDQISQNLTHPSKPIVITDKLPNERHHGWRYLRVGPDEKLYVSIGAPCNACLSSDPRFASIMRMNLDGSNPEVIAHGVRNSVGFAWHPHTKQLWFTDNGRDWLGDNLPPDELNHLTKVEQHFGFPFFYGQNVPDPEFIKQAPKRQYIKPSLDLPAHVAALGIAFYTGKQFPASYQNKIFIAQHGSWNRSSKVGYQVIQVNIEGDKITGWQPFISGWLKNGVDWGRPVDLLVMRDGSLLISDDRNGVIYRVSYKNS